MSSKKEELNLDNSGSGTKTTTETRDDGSQTITVEKVHTDWTDTRRVGETISTETRTPKGKDS